MVSIKGTDNLLYNFVFFEFQMLLVQSILTKKTDARACLANFSCTMY